MVDSKKYLILLLLLQICSTFSNSSIIVLYGCSSVGKTSIATELIKTLPGQWKYIPSNRFKSSSSSATNSMLWSHIKTTIANGYNVIVDTHNAQMLMDHHSNINLLVVFLHCSPHKLIEHLNKRNNDDNPQTHRKLSTVLKEFCDKYKAVKKDNPHQVETLHKQELKDYSFITSLALKKVINSYFTQKNQETAYIAPLCNNYDILVDTGKLSITGCAHKIKNEFMLRFG